jgi:phosphoserine phosphatase
LTPAPRPFPAGRRRIYLMRHGHVDYFAPEVVLNKDPTLARLTPQGETEAKAAGLALREVSLDRAISSGLIRTQTTADHVLSAHSAPPALEHDPRLQELKSGTYIPFETREALASYMTAQLGRAAEPGARFFEAGETFEAGFERVSAAMSDLFDDEDWQTALVVAHEGINRMILSWVACGTLAAAVAFEQDTGCINIIDVDQHWTPNGNQTAHAVIKAVNLTPINYLKNGMTLRSFEAIFHAPHAPKESH